MPGENDQTKTEQTKELENEDQNQLTQEQQQDKAATEKAVKSSKDFDALIDKEGVDETPSEESVSTSEDDKNKQNPESKEKDDDDADDIDAGKSEQTEDKGEQTQGDTYKVGAELAKKAIDLGLAEDEIASFDNDEELQKTLAIIEKIINEPEEQQPPQPAAKPGEKKEEPESVLKFENEEDIDPEILKGLKAMEKHYQSEITKLRETVNAMQQNNQKAQQDQFVKRFDSMIDKLGLNFADVFGKGSTNDLSKRSIAYKNRDAVRARMYAFGKGFIEAGQSVPEEQQLFDLAIHSLHGKKIEDVNNAARSTKAKTYAKGARVGRPAAKSAGNLTPQQKAVETSKNFDALIDTSED